MWRSHDRPIVGTIFRLPDITSLVRGITFTILPNGKSMRVPTMSRAKVRAESNKHAEGEESQIMQALHDLMHGKTPQAGRGRRNPVRGHHTQHPELRGYQHVRAPPNREPRNGMPLDVVQEM